MIALWCHVSSYWQHREHGESAVKWCSVLLAHPRGHPSSRKHWTPWLSLGAGLWNGPISFRFGDAVTQKDAQTLQGPSQWQFSCYGTVSGVWTALGKRCGSSGIWWCFGDTATREALRFPRGQEGDFHWLPFPHCLPKGLKEKSCESACLLRIAQGLLCFMG